MLFKIFRRIEPLISKRFKLLASLAAKLEAKTYNKGEYIVKAGEKLDKIMLIYSGQASVSEDLLKEPIPHMLQSGEVIGYWHFMKKNYKRNVSFSAKPITEHVNVLEISLSDIDVSLEQINHN